MFAYVCNMLLYIMYQSFLNCDWLCFDYLFEILILISFFLVLLMIIDDTSTNKVFTDDTNRVIVAYLINKDL